MSEHTVRAKQDNLAHGILAGDFLKVRQQSAGEPGDLVVDSAGHVRPFEAGVIVLGKVLEVWGPRS